MDVVKRNITALRGTVEIDSTAGVGTTISVRLPLTLAIINGFQVGVGKSVFVVPLDVVEECVEFTPDYASDYIDLRGSVLPYVRLRELFALGGKTAARKHRGDPSRCAAFRPGCGHLAGRMADGDQAAVQGVCAGQGHQRVEHSGQRRCRADSGCAQPDSAIAPNQNALAA